jgi:hypothetical protein
MTIEPGMVLEARTAGGEEIQVRALGRPMKGRDFPIVWVCTEEEYQRAQESASEADGIPWPLDAIRVSALA